MTPALMPKGNRREFLRNAARCAAVAGIAAVAAVVSPWIRHVPGGSSCLDGRFCHGCPALGACGLPAALLARRVRSRG